MESQAEQLLGNFDMSIKNLYDTKKYIRPQDRRQLAQLHSLMGRVYSKLGDYNKAIELNDRATSAFKALGDSAAVAECYNERGVMHYSLNETLIAERFFRRALAINRALRNLKGVATNLSNMCLYGGNTEEKLALIREAIAINKNLDSQWALGENYNNMGKQHCFAGQYAEALEALHKAYEYAHGIGARELVCDNYEYLSLVYAAMGSYRQAYSHLRKMQALANELRNNNKLRSIEQEISYRKNEELKLHAERQRQDHKMKLLQRNLWLLGIVFGAAVVLAIILSKWYKHRKELQLVEARCLLEQSERQLSELKLKQQEQELRHIQSALHTSRNEATNLAIFLQSRNELLDKIRNMIREGYRMDATQLVPHLKKINVFITQYQRRDEESKTLLQEIEQKSNEFLRRLVALHPKLTQGEKHLATLLRANLATKEIAVLTGVTAKTINMNRYRLRKSLGLSADEELGDYLQKI